MLTLDQRLLFRLSTEAERSNRMCREANSTLCSSRDVIDFAKKYVADALRPQAALTPEFSVGS